MNIKQMINKSVRQLTLTASLFALFFVPLLTLSGFSVMAADSNTADQEQGYKAKLSTFIAPDGNSYDYQAFIDNFKIPGMSFAVVENFEVVYAHHVGLKETGTTNKLDSNTAFSTASIAKPVTATIAAMLAEKGKLDLDAPIAQYLKRWQVPSSDFTRNSPITTRQLLAHTAGMSQGGFADFHLGDDIPSPIESLNGKKLPRYDQPIRSLFTPDTDWQYSGGGYVIVQIALEDITGKPLQQLAQEMIFTPLNMQHTTMYQHGSDQFLTNVAKVHDASQQVIRDGIPICPQIAPSGLWSTPSDMAKFTIEYQQALAGQASSVISPWVAQQTTRLHTLKKVGGWSAGWMRFEAQGNIDWFSHGGSNTGTGGHVMASMQGGKGILVFMNATTEHRNPAIEALIKNIIDALDWHQELPFTKLIPAQYKKQMIGRYLSGLDQIITIREQGDELIYTDPMRMGGVSYQAELQYAGIHNSRATFSLNENANQISVGVHPDSKQHYLVLSRRGGSREDEGLEEFSMRKLPKNERLPSEVAQEEGLEQSKKAYIAWKAQYPDSSLVAPRAINNAGYAALAKQDFKAALNFFHVYTHLYPQDANAYDSLAEAQVLSGDKESAISNFKRSLALNPKNENAKKMIQEIQSKR
jgi:CubicO group peptidase (beta-lactamase class C family)